MSLVEGKMVEHKSKSNVRGRILEIADGRAYIQRSNGVEDDYPLDDLIDVEAVQAAKIAAEQIEIAERDAKFPRFDEIWAALGEAEFQSIIINLYNRVPFRVGDFENLNNFQKMNFIGVMFDTTYDTLLSIITERKNLNVYLLWQLGTVGIAAVLVNAAVNKARM